MDEAAPAPSPAPAAPVSKARYTNMTASHKVAVGGAGGAAAIVVVWAVKQVWHIDVPAEVAMAFGTLITTAGAIFVPTFNA